MRNSMKGLAAALLVAACGVLTGCDGPVPVSKDVTMDLGQGYALSVLDGLPAGAAIYVNSNIPGLAVCTLPTQAQMVAQVKLAAGSLISPALDVDEIEILQLEVRAVTGSFDTFTRLSAAWRPSAEDSAPVEPIPLGFAADPAGLGGDITLEPPETVDLLTLAAYEEQSQAPECPELLIQIDGTVPDIVPTLGIKAKLRVHGTLGL